MVPGTTTRDTTTRRRVLTGLAAGTGAWVAPSVLSLDTVAAATGSGCPGAVTNLAIAGTASQISTGFGGVASRGNDGNINGNYFANPRSVFHTNRHVGAWWEVDLGGLFFITEVRLWNRTDCCTTRARDVQISVDGTVQGTNPGFVGRPSTVALGCEGQVVRVTNGASAGNQFLQLAEVQVFGCTA